MGNQNNKSERVKVYIRIRPFNEAEMNIGGETPFKSIDTKNNVLSIKTDFSTKTLAYDGIYDQNSTQDQIFNISAKPVIDVRLKKIKIFYLMIKFINIVCFRRI
jgi:hypothetical protein